MRSPATAWFTTPSSSVSITRNRRTYRPSGPFGEEHGATAPTRHGHNAGRGARFRGRRQRRQRAGTDRQLLDRDRVLLTKPDSDHRRDHDHLVKRHHPCAHGNRGQRSLGYRRHCYRGNQLGHHLQHTGNIRVPLPLSCGMHGNIVVTAAATSTPAATAAPTARSSAGRTVRALAQSGGGAAAVLGLLMALGGLLVLSTGWLRRQRR